MSAHVDSRLTPFTPSNSVRCDFACINVPVHEVVTQERVLSPPPVNLGTSNVDDLLQKLRHPKSKKKRSENNSRLVVGSWVNKISH